MHVVAGQRVQVAGERGHERLALAGLHLGDVAVVERHAADELHVEVAHAQRAHAGLAHGRERLGQQVVELLAALEALAELDRAPRQLLGGFRLHRGFDVVNAPLHFLVGLNLPAFAE